MQGSGGDRDTPGAKELMGHHLQMAAAPGLACWRIRYAVGFVPKRACMAVSSNPWARAKLVRLAISGKAASLVITFMFFPRGTTCKPALVLGVSARACRCVLNICPDRIWEKSLPWAFESTFLAAGSACPALGETCVGVKELSFASM